MNKFLLGSTILKLLLVLAGINRGFDIAYSGLEQNEFRELLCSTRKGSGNTQEIRRN
jgi:hypothetical protein